MSNKSLYAFLAEGIPFHKRPVPKEDDTLTQQVSDILDTLPPPASPATIPCPPPDFSPNFDE